MEEEHPPSGVVWAIESKENIQDLWKDVDVTSDVVGFDASLQLSVETIYEVDVDSSVLCHLSLATIHHCLKIFFIIIQVLGDHWISEMSIYVTRITWHRVHDVVKGFQYLFRYSLEKMFVQLLLQYIGKKSMDTCASVIEFSFDEASQ